MKMLLLLISILVAVVIYLVNDIHQSKLVSEQTDIVKVDILIPSLCRTHVENFLKSERLIENIDFKFSKFLHLNDTYKDIDSFLSLMSNEGQLDKLVDIAGKMQNKCFSSGFVAIVRNGTEWSELSREVELLKKAKVPVHKVVIEEGQIKLFLNIKDYERVY